MTKVTPKMIGNLNGQWPTNYLHGMNVIWDGRPFLLQPDENAPQEFLDTIPEMEELDDLCDPAWEWAFICDPMGEEWHYVEVEWLESDVPLKPCGCREGRPCHQESENDPGSECVEP